MRGLWLFLLLGLLYSAYGGILKDIGKEIINFPLGKDSTMPTRVPKKPLNHNEQDYLTDNAENQPQSQGYEKDESGASPTRVSKQPHYNEEHYLSDKTQQLIKAEKAENLNSGIGAETEYKMKAGQNSYEFDVNHVKCKFYSEARQRQRSLECNQKRCALDKTARWKCDTFSCNIKEDTKKAFCKGAGDDRHIINAPERNPCTGGQVKQNGHCRDKV